MGIKKIINYINDLDNLLKHNICIECNTHDNEIHKLIQDKTIYCQDNRIYLSNSLEKALFFNYYYTTNNHLVMCKSLCINKKPIEPRTTVLDIKDGRNNDLGVKLFTDYLELLKQLLIDRKSVIINLTNVPLVSKIDIINVKQSPYFKVDDNIKTKNYEIHEKLIKIQEKYKVINLNILNNYNTFIIVDDIYTSGTTLEYFKNIVHKRVKSSDIKIYYYVYGKTLDLKNKTKVV